MPNTKKWSEIVATRSKPGVLEAIEADRARDALLLSELRRARELTQEALAQNLGISQSEVSKVERRTDIYVSTLRKYIEAMDGELQLIARFPNGSVEIFTLTPELEDPQLSEV